MNTGTCGVIAPGEFCSRMRVRSALAIGTPLKTSLVGTDRYRSTMASVHSDVTAAVSAIVLGVRMSESASFG